MAHYFPQLDINEMDDEDFAYWSENALWLHESMMMIQQSNAAAMMGAKPKKK